ncbi:MAG: erythromycin esterase family protein [Nocardiaceae bacterium]|nr:erythromycin esterase family protein [Nocardiaceae bacterium]
MTSNASSSAHVFRDRREAGQTLAAMLEHHRQDDKLVVLGLARGGVPIAAEIAKALGADLDAFIVRKLGAPGHEEVAVGAIAGGGRLVVNDDLVRGLRLTSEELRLIAVREGRELRRREIAYRGNRPPIDVAGKTVILADDGLATGASMFAAVDAIRDGEPAKIIVAVPAAPESTIRELSAMVDEVVCASMPRPFFAVGASYWDFSQVTDEEVRSLLAKPTQKRAPRGPGHAAVIRELAIDAPSGIPPKEEIFDLVGDADIVLIGESTHGTHEFYAARAEITKLLIAERGFRAVAAEADWPDALRVNRYVQGRGQDATAEEALRGFERFPSWMWRNTVVRDFAEWLRDFNRTAPKTAGFYGLDLYSLHRSMREIITYLEGVDPMAAIRARRRYSCFDHVSGDDGQSYGYAAAYGAGEKCEQQVIDQLSDLRRNAAAYLALDGTVAEDEQFYAEGNAHAVRNAEQYYREMFGGRVSSWNLRDQHMAETLQLLSHHLSRNGERARIVVWAHNSHVGDARATEVHEDGQLTLGQLVREQVGYKCRLIGFSTHSGTVTAASNWGGSAERKRVRPALPASVEELFHDTGKPEFLIRSDAAPEALRSLRLGRAIGVVYLPATERQSHYYHVRPGSQFDAMIHIDHTTALQPLESTSTWVAGETPETYPSGL